MTPAEIYPLLIDKRMRDKVEINCSICNRLFTTNKRIVYNGMIRNQTAICCSSSRIKKAMLISKKLEPSTIVLCSQCHKEIIRQVSDIRSKSGRCFCSCSCAATYNNTHKTVGCRRSKLESWLEQKLKIDFPTLVFIFNDKEAINSELDIYIPSLKLAFELNGIFHYEPIYGKDKLNKTQNNDNRKFQACLEHEIELCIIDSRQQKRFTEKSSIKYIGIITAIINSKLVGDIGIEPIRPYGQ